MPRKAATASVADEDAAIGGVAAVDRALSLLAAFSAAQSALSLAELAQAARLYKSTVLRLLASLLHAGLVLQRVDGRYALGPQIARLSSVYARSFSLGDAVLPALQQLVDETGESAAFHIRQGDARLCLYRVDSPRPVRDHIRAGDLLPLDRGAGARVLDAWASPSARLSGARNARLARDVRRLGYFAGIGDREKDIAGISAPVFNADGSLAGALTLTTPSHRYQAAHVESVLRAAASLSTALGHAG
ncbi:MAG: IclR family transcriptional regulator [Burkholderiales bacterium]|nr:IclR family transcriptional regulator [Burkholderiales bacterium]